MKRKMFLFLAVLLVTARDEPIHCLGRTTRNSLLFSTTADKAPHPLRLINPPMRSPREKVGGLYHFGRMMDKIRLHLRRELPNEYRPHFGLSAGLDGHLCGFLGVAHEELVQQAVLGKSDLEILEWCFATRFRPNPVQRRIWNSFALKFGWQDLASEFLESVKLEEGLADRDDLVTAFDIIDTREGRSQAKGRKAAGL